MSQTKVYMNDLNLTRVLGKMESTLDRKSNWTAYTIAASGWNSSTNTYSFETAYPSSSYDILDILPSQTASDAQRNAWIAADCGGYYSTNIVVAHGSVPTIDIPVMLCLQEK